MTRLEFSLLLAMQMRGRRVPMRGQQLPKEQDLAYPIFKGKLRALSHSKLSIEVENGNSMDFRVLRTTKFLQDEKQVKPGMFSIGDMVAVECRHAPDASLDAVTVRLAPPSDPPKN